MARFVGDGRKPIGKVLFVLFVPAGKPVFERFRVLVAWGQFWFFEDDDGSVGKIVCS